MKAKTLIKLVLPTVTILAGPALHAADEPVQSSNAVSAEITPKLYYFDYDKGFGTDRTQFLERYNYQKSGDNRSGFYPDVDASVLVTNSQRDVFELERQGFGAYNQRGTVKADSDKLGFSGYYSSFRSATGGIDFLYSPNQVVGGTDPTYNVPANTNTGYVAQFNDDAAGQTLYKIDRTTYGARLALKPTLFGTTASAALKYDGYQRDGNRFATYVAGGGDVTGGAARVLQRWRGFDMPVNEKMNRYTLNLSGVPGGFALSYEGSLEKFDNQARDVLMGDFAANFAGFFNAPSATKPLHFVPDSTLISNNLRVARNFGSTAVAAGYGLSVLDQDSFAQNQQAAGYNIGKITTNSAYLNVHSNALSGVGLEGFVKYNNRDNDSTFPATGLIDPAVQEKLDVRINTIKSLSYGLSATFRPTTLKSAVTVGWKREDRDRDLTWALLTTRSIQPQQSLYRQQTFSDELYVNWVARPMPGLIVRVSPSYLSANETGLVTEPAESFNLKTKVSYALNGATAVSGYYNYKNKKNDNNTLTNGIAAAVSGSLTQNTDNTQQSAGVSLSLTPNEKLTTTASLGWMQNDFASYFISEQRRRYEQLIGSTNDVVFATRGTPNYKVDTYVFSVGADLQASSVLSYSGNYTYSHSKGSNASGLGIPTVDEQVNNDVQTVSLGANYAIKKSMKIKGSYAYDYYNDKVYSSMTGGYHTLMVGVSLGF
ncbi:MAG: hypothetical protein M1547_10045 [Gammaproteobacteria bacterium]|nr:hypothetical protein [Gammaproteobacteria bacterium]